MTFKQWLMVIGLTTVVGMTEVCEQTAIRLKAYELGRQQLKLQRLANDTLWLKTKVVELKSPARLAKVAREQTKTMVAWSELPARPTGPRLVRADRDSSSNQIAD